MKQHIAESAEVRRVFGTGEKIEALCGVKWAPKKEGSLKRKFCLKCAEALGNDPVRLYKKDEPAFVMPEPVMITLTMTVPKDWKMEVY